MSDNAIKELLNKCEKKINKNKPLFDQEGKPSFASEGATVEDVVGCLLKLETNDKKIAKDIFNYLTGNVLKSLDAKQQWAIFSRYFISDNTLHRETLERFCHTLPTESLQTMLREGLVQCKTNPITVSRKLFESLFDWFATSNLFISKNKEVVFYHLLFALVVNDNDLTNLFNKVSNRREAKGYLDKIAHHLQINLNNNNCNSFAIALLRQRKKPESPEKIFEPRETETPLQNFQESVQGKSISDFAKESPEEYREFFLDIINDLKDDFHHTKMFPLLRGTPAFFMLFSFLDSESIREVFHPIILHGRYTVTKEAQPKFIEEIINYAFKESGNEKLKTAAANLLLMLQQEVDMPIDEGFLARAVQVDGLKEKIVEEATLVLEDKFLSDTRRFQYQNQIRFRPAVRSKNIITGNAVKTHNCYFDSLGIAILNKNRGKNVANLGVTNSMQTLLKIKTPIAYLFSKKTLNWIKNLDVGNQYTLITKTFRDILIHENLELQRNIYRFENLINDKTPTYADIEFCIRVLIEHNGHEKILSKLIYNFVNKNFLNKPDWLNNTDKACNYKTMVMQLSAVKQAASVLQLFLDNFAATRPESNIIKEQDKWLPLGLLERDKNSITAVGHFKKTHGIEVEEPKTSMNNKFDSTAEMLSELITIPNHDITIEETFSILFLKTLEPINSLLGHLINPNAKQFISELIDLGIEKNNQSFSESTFYGLEKIFDSLEINSGDYLSLVPTEKFDGFLVELLDTINSNKEKLPEKFYSKATDFILKNGEKELLNILEKKIIRLVYQNQTSDLSPLIFLLQNLYKRVLVEFFHERFFTKEHDYNLDISAQPQPNAAMNWVLEQLMTTTSPQKDKDIAAHLLLLIKDPGRDNLSAEGVLTIIKQHSGIKPRIQQAVHFFLTNINYDLDAREKFRKNFLQRSEITNNSKSNMGYNYNSVAAVIANKNTGTTVFNNKTRTVTEIESYQLRPKVEKNTNGMAKSSNNSRKEQNITRNLSLLIFGKSLALQNNNNNNSQTKPSKEEVEMDDFGSKNSFNN